MNILTTILSPASKVRVAVSAITILTILISSCILYRKASGLNKGNKHTTIAQEVQDAKKRYQEASNEASVSVAKVVNRKNIEVVVKVGTILNQEEMTTLQTRERDDLSAIQALQTEVTAANNVIHLQDTEILENKTKLIIWKVIAGVLVAIIVYILL